MCLVVVSASETVVQIRSVWLLPELLVVMVTLRCWHWTAAAAAAAAHVCLLRFRFGVYGEIIVLCSRTAARP